MIYYLNSLPSGDESIFKPIFNRGVWTLNDYSVVASSTAPAAYIINEDGFIVSESTTSGRNSGFTIVPNDVDIEHNIAIIMKSMSSNVSGQYQCGQCTLTADAYKCARTGEGRLSYVEGSLSNLQRKFIGQNVLNNRAFFIAFGQSLGIMSIYSFKL